MYSKLDGFIGELIGYKKMTEILDLSYQKGNGKEAQLKDIQRYYELEKIKSKYLIVKKFDNPIEKIDGRQSEYYEDLKTIILFALSEERKNTSVNWSVGKALQLANFVNKNFRYCNDKTMSSVSMALEVDRFYVYDFYNISNTKFKRIFENVLNAMERRGIIDWHECTMVCKRVSEIEKNELGEPVIKENGTIKYNITKQYREATAEERLVISETKTKILEELKLEDTSECFKRGRWNTFKNMMNKELSKTLNIDFYYKGYSIVKNMKYIHEIITKINKDTCAANVNFRAINDLKISTNAKLTRDIDSRDVLIDYLIDEDAIHIRELIKNMTTTQDELERDLFPF